MPQDHLLRKIDRFLDLSDLHQHLAPYYSHTGRPSIDPERMMRMLIIGFCLGIRSERRLCEEVKLNLAYRWFCRLSIEDPVPVKPAKRVSPTDPQARWTAAPGGPAFYAYSTNYLVDTDAGIIVDVEATPAHRTLEVQSAKTMIERVEERVALKTRKLIGDTADGTAEILGWMVEEKGIEPHVPVWEKAERRTAPSAVPTSAMTPSMTSTPVRPPSDSSNTGQLAGKPGTARSRARRCAITRLKGTARVAP